MREWLSQNWRTFVRVAFVLGVYLFVRQYPLTEGERDDLYLIVVGAGIWGTLAPGLREARRQDDPK